MVCATRLDAPGVDFLSLAAGLPPIAALILVVVFFRQDAPNLTVAFSNDGQFFSKEGLGALHGCSWETCFYMFADCGLVVGIPHLTAKKHVFAPLSTSTKPFFGGHTWLWAESPSGCFAAVFSLFFLKACAREHWIFEIALHCTETRQLHPPVIVGELLLKDYMRWVALGGEDFPCGQLGPLAIPKPCNEDQPCIWQPSLGQGHKNHPRKSQVAKAHHWGPPKCTRFLRPVPGDGDPQHLGPH